MKISELITDLQQKKRELGDQEVFTLLHWCDQGGKERKVDILLLVRNDGLGIVAS